MLVCLQDAGAGNGPAEAGARHSSVRAAQPPDEQAFAHSLIHAQVLGVCHPGAGGAGEDPAGATGRRHVCVAGCEPRGDASMR